MPLLLRGLGTGAAARATSRYGLLYGRALSDRACTRSLHASAVALGKKKKKRDKCDLAASPTLHHGTVEELGQCQSPQEGTDNSTDWAAGSGKTVAFMPNDNSTSTRQSPALGAQFHRGVGTFFATGDDLGRDDGQYAELMWERRRPTVDCFFKTAPAQMGMRRHRQIIPGMREREHGATKVIRTALLSARIVRGVDLYSVGWRYIGWGILIRRRLSEKWRRILPCTVEKRSLFTYLARFWTKNSCCLRVWCRILSSSKHSESTLCLSLAADRRCDAH